VRRYYCGILVLLLFGCGTKFSVGLTYTNHDEIKNPLGVVRADNQFSEHWGGACEHISSAFETHDVIALDHCGIFYTF